MKKFHGWALIFFILSHYKGFLYQTIASYHWVGFFSIWSVNPSFFFFNIHFLTIIWKLENLLLRIILVDGGEREHTFNKFYIPWNNDFFRSSHHIFYTFLFLLGIQWKLLVSPLIQIFPLLFLCSNNTPITQRPLGGYNLVFGDIRSRKVICFLSLPRVAD